LAVGRDGEEGRVLDLGGDLGDGQGALLGVELAAVDALAAALPAGVGAVVDPVVVGGGRERCECEQREGGEDEAGHGISPAEAGTIWVNGPGRLPDLLTKQSFGDCEVHVEFLIPKGSNSGIKFHAVYEIQILDSAGKPTDKLTGDDLGGIYPRAELTPKYHH